MRIWEVVKLRNPEKYEPLAKQYGIMVDSLENTAVINFNSNASGICVNIPHDEYGIVSPDFWDIMDDEIVITPYGGHMRTGLKIYT